MSRTYKDCPTRVRFPKYDKSKWDDKYDIYEYPAISHSGYEYIGRWYADKPGYFPKLRKEQDGEWHWCEDAPSWFIRMFMTRPARRQWRLWERRVIHEREVEETDYPNFGNKPFMYYY